MPQVFFAIPMERAILEPAANALFKVCLRAGRMGYNRIETQYARTDRARDEIVRVFRQHAKSPKDKLVMLDVDHTHPATVVEQLVAASVGVVGGLTYRRGNNFQPLFFIHDPENPEVYITPDEWNPGALLEIDFVGTGAICIENWVFDKIEKEIPGAPPFFCYTYEYSLQGTYPAEDWYFARLCERAGIKHYVDTALVCPHLTWRTIADNDFRDYLAAHPEEAQE